VLVFHLVGVGLSQQKNGVLLTLTLGLTRSFPWPITTRAERMGRRQMLIGGALLNDGRTLNENATQNRGDVTPMSGISMI
jgi:hypothetical protein